MLTCTIITSPVQQAMTNLCLMQLFSKAGDVKRLIMGLDANRRTPCGFCFVSYFTRKDAEAAVKYINGSMMDGRAIRVDHDWGFVEGRQFGRGRSGGQVRLVIVPRHACCIYKCVALTNTCILMCVWHASLHASITSRLLQWCCTYASDPFSMVHC